MSGAWQPGPVFRLHYQKKLQELRTKWQQERSSLDRVGELTKQIDSTRTEIEKAQREGDLEKASKLMYGQMRELENQLAKAREDATKSSQMVAEEVTAAEETVKAANPKQSVQLTSPPPKANDKARRKERDENAELWALLRQSKTRIEETKNLVPDIDDTVDEDEEEGNEDNNEDYGTKKGKELPSQVTGGHEDEKKDEESSRRNFQKENEELWELLVQSKRRLEEAALQKAKQAEQAAAADESSTFDALKKNPYQEINKLPDQPTVDENELSMKELLIAMAAAEEAARSGSETFVSPPKEILRNRDLDSFEFLKAESQKEQQSKQPLKQPPKPLSGPEEIAREQSRFRLLRKTLANKWSDFKKRTKDIDKQIHEWVSGLFHPYDSEN